MKMDRSRKRQKAQWARALEAPKKERWPDDWGVTEREGEPPTLIAGDPYEPCDWGLTRVQRAIDYAYSTQDVCVNCGGSGTVWYRDVQSLGTFKRGYKVINAGCGNCPVCTPGGFE